MTVKIDDDQTAEVLATSPDKKIVVVKMADTGEVQEVQESRVTSLGDGSLFDSKNSLLNNIQKFINEAKKRKAADEQEPHYLLFLSDKKKAAWYNLSANDKEKINVAINESEGYTSEADVLKIMEKALSTTQKSKEELLIEAMPADIKPIWEKMDVVHQQSILNQAELIPSLNESKFESFWLTRDFSAYTKTTKKLLNEDVKSYDNYKLSESLVERYLDQLNNLK